MRVTNLACGTLALTSQDPSKTVEALSILLFCLMAALFAVPIVLEPTVLRCVVFGPLAIMCLYFGSGTLVHFESIQIDVVRKTITWTERWLTRSTTCRLPWDCVQAVIIAKAKTRRVRSAETRDAYRLMLKVSAVQKQKSGMLFIHTYVVKRHAYDAARTIADYSGWPEVQMKSEEISDSKWREWDDYLDESV